MIAQARLKIFLFFGLNIIDRGYYTRNLEFWNIIVDMAQLDRRRFMTKLKHSPLAYLVLILFASLFIYSAIGAYNKSRLAETRMNTAQAELANLEDQKARLTVELENANTDFGQEKALREKFNVVKEGEQVIMIVNKAEAQESEETSTKAGFWTRIFGKK